MSSPGEKGDLPSAEASPPAGAPDVGHFVIVARAKAEWEQTVDAIDDPIALQEGTRIRRGNRALANAGEISVRDLPGRTCHALVAGRSTPCLGCPLAEGAPVGREQSFEIRTETGRSFSVSLFPLVGTKDGWVVRHRDVTVEREAVARAREQERLAAVGRLAAGAAHEINNPLSFVIANVASLGRDLERIGVVVQTLERALAQLGRGEREGALALLARFQGAPQLRALSALAGDGPQRVAEALEGSQRVAGIVRALRRLADERTGEAAPVDLADCLDRAADRLRAEVAEKDLGPLVHDRVALPVRGHAQALDEALYHLLHNAWRFGPQGAPLRVGGGISDGKAVLRIEDVGQGMPPEVLTRAFEPFFTTCPPGNGLGLGLTIAYGVVRQHGGEIRIESEPGKGTVVEIRLPVRSEPREDLGVGDGTLAQAG